MRSYSGFFSCSLASFFRKLYRKHTHRISQKKKNELSFFFSFDVQRMDSDGVYDYNRHIVTPVSSVARIFHCRILYRTFPLRTNRYRNPIHYLLVEKQTLASISQVLLPLYFIEKATSLQAAFQVIFFPTGYY